MKNFAQLQRWSFAILTFSVLYTNVYSQATRTWVSGVGDDANPCSRTAPCKTFAGAISKTAAGGEISVLDPGGFGAVTITKSITLNGDGTLAGILASGTNGIVINAGVNDRVILRNISINGAGTGTRGIRYIAGGQVLVDNCTIIGFNAAPATAIEANLTAAGVLSIRNVSISDCDTGIVTKTTVGKVKVSIENTSIVGATVAMNANDNSVVYAQNSIFNNGVSSIRAFLGAIVNLSQCAVTNNTTGVWADGSGSLIRLSDCNIFNNTDGIKTTNGGQVISFGNNSVAGNTTNAPMGVVARQ
jgi:hypothetical protein